MTMDGKTFKPLEITDSFEWHEPDWQGEKP
jgi:hypothetical protein